MFILLISGCSEPEELQAGESSQSGICLPESYINKIALEEVNSELTNQTLRLSGQITTNNERVYHVYPAAGGVISDVPVRIGDRVEKGQVLATVESPDIAEFQKQKLEAGSALDIAERNLDMANSLFESGVYSRRDLLKAENAMEAARAELQRIHRQQLVLGIHENEEVYSVKAPEAGYVVERAINPGMHLRADNGSHLFKISDLRDVWVIANIYESDIQHMSPNTPVSVTVPAWPDYTFNGEIVRISNVLDPDRRVLEAVIHLPNPDLRLKPGMFANIDVNITGDELSAVVSSNALIFNNNRHFVVVYQDVCEMEIRDVAVRHRNGQQAYIQSGLDAGETIVSSGHLLIYNELLANGQL